MCLVTLLCFGQWSADGRKPCGREELRHLTSSRGMGKTLDLSVTIHVRLEYLNRFIEQQDFVLIPIHDHSSRILTKLLVLASAISTPQVIQVNYIYYVLSSKNLNYLA